MSSVQIVTRSSATYSVVLADNGKLFIESYNGAAAYNLPASPPPNGWSIEVWCAAPLVGGYLNVNGNGLNIDGVASAFPINKGNGVRFYSDGSNYYSCTTRKAGVVQESANLGARPAIVNYYSVQLGGAANGNIYGSGGSNTTQTAAANFLIGTSSTNTGGYDIGIGTGNTVGNTGVTNGYNIVLGFSAQAATTYGANGCIAFGYAAVANYAASIAIGQYATTLHKGDITFGTSQSAKVTPHIAMLVRDCTAASTDYQLTSTSQVGAADNQIPCPANSTVAFKGRVTVRQLNSAGNNYGVFEVSGIMHRQASGNITLTSTVTAFAGITNPTGWAVTMAVDNTNYLLNLNFNMGSTAMSLRAAARIDWHVVNY